MALRVGAETHLKSLLNIHPCDREIYYQHLVTANEGDIRPFVRFIAECTENTLDAYLWASKEYYGPPVGELGGEEELPYNLVEHSLEQVNTQLSQLTGGSPWLNFDPLNDKVRNKYFIFREKK